MAEEAGGVREIVSLTNPLVKQLRALHQRKERRESGLFLAEGARTIVEALDNGQAPEILVYHRDGRERAIIARLREACLAAGGTCIETNDTVLAKISRKDNPQSVVAAFRWVERGFRCDRSRQRARLRGARPGARSGQSRYRHPHRRCGGRGGACS